MGANNSSHLSRLERALAALSAAADLENAMRKSRLPQEMVHKMHKTFMDACPDSRMSREKFRTFYESFFSGAKSGCFQFFDHLFRAFDTDGNGTLDFMEFLQIFDTLYCGTPDEKLELTFRVCDIDASGTVEEEELQDIIAAMLQMSDLSPAERLRLPVTLAKNMFRRLDTDGDGHLSKEEFVQGCTNEPQIYEIFSAAFSVQDL